MANNNVQDTSNSQNNISMPIQPQQGQPKEKIQQQSSELERRQKKITQNNTHKRKSILETERDKQKAEYEKSGNELSRLMAQFGAKAKVADDLDNDTKKLRHRIETLKMKAQEVRLNNNKPTPIQVTQVTPPPLSQLSQPFSTIEQQQGIITLVLDNLLHMILFPFNLIINLIRLLYNSVNWTILLSCVLFVEFAMIGLVWTVRRNHAYAYVEPYEPVVHGTYGVDPTISWGISSAINSVNDFIGEVMYGGRGFGSPSYDGFVPI